MQTRWEPATEVERQAYVEIKGFRQPKCPGCGGLMTLDVTTFDDGTVAANYLCNRITCPGGWATRYSTARCGLDAMLDAYKSAMTRM